MAPTKGVRARHCCSPRSRATSIVGCRTGSQRARPPETVSLFPRPCANTNFLRSLGPWQDQAGRSFDDSAAHCRRAAHCKRPLSITIRDLSSGVKPAFYRLKPPPPRALRLFDGYRTIVKRAICAQLFDPIAELAILRAGLRYLSICRWSKRSGSLAVGGCAKKVEVKGEFAEDGLWETESKIWEEKVALISKIYD